MASIILNLKAGEEKDFRWAMGLHLKCMTEPEDGEKPEPRPATLEEIQHHFQDQLCKIHYATAKQWHKDHPPCDKYCDGLN